MKKIIVLFIFFAGSMQYVFAATDSSIIELNKKTTALQTSVDTTKKELLDSLKSGLEKKTCNCVPHITEIT
jgi:hypothetical protein